MSVNSKDQLVLRGVSYKSCEQLIWTVTRQTGNTTAQIASQCHCRLCPMMRYPDNPDFILETCARCKVIRRYNINTAESEIVYEGCKPWKVCEGPEGSVFVIDVEGELLLLEWREEKKELELVHRKQTGVETAYGISYMEQFNILVITSRQNIKAIKPKNGISCMGDYTGCGGKEAGSTWGFL